MQEKKIDIREHVVKDSVIVDHHCYCDQCGKEIPNGTLRFMGYYGHNDWGNDSCESDEWVDVCVDCIGDFVRDKTKEYLDDRPFGSTLHFRLEMECFKSKAIK